MSTSQSFGASTARGSRWSVLVSAGILGLLTAGCSAPVDGQEPIATVTVEAPAEDTAQPTPTAPTPTPAPITAEAAGEQYLALVEPYNAAINAVALAVEADDMAALRAASGEYAAAARTFADGLVAAEWPPEAQPLVDRMVGELAQRIPPAISLAQTGTDEETRIALATLPDVASSSQELRIILGLDDVQPLP